MPTEREGDSLPRYSPAIYKIGVVSRSWSGSLPTNLNEVGRHMVMELNSTQVNLFNSSHLETHVVNYCHGWAGGSLDTNDLVTPNLPSPCHRTAS